MEMILIAVVVAVLMWQYLSILAAAHDVKALQDRCRYLEHLVGDLVKRQPDRLEGDEWKDGAANGEDE